jgi:5-methylcytosine-specific restriction endonuclease McrA
VCEECGCELTWSDLQADHIKPFTVGGQTELANAAILCAKHNASKGKKSPAAVGRRGMAEAF